MRLNSPVTTDAAAVSGSWQSAQRGTAAESLPPSRGRPRCATASGLLGAHSCLWTRPAPTGEGERVGGPQCQGHAFPDTRRLALLTTRDVVWPLNTCWRVQEGAPSRVRGRLRHRTRARGAEAGCHQGRAWPAGQQASPSALWVGGDECPDTEWRPPPPGSSPGLKKEFLLPPPHSLLLGRK